MLGSAIGLFLPSVVDSMTKRCEEFIENKIKLLRGAEGEFSRLRRNLRYMRGVIEHVVESQSKNDAVRVWLEDLEEVLYDAEDLLDLTMVDISLGKGEADGGIAEPIRIETSTVGKYMRGNPKAEQIKEINDKIDDIIKRGQRWGLLMIAETARQESSSLLKNRETSSIADVDFPLIGRDDIASKIINMLVQKVSSSNVRDRDDHMLSVLPIIGMGGVGKTTLARYVFNDKQKVEPHFKLKMWVSIGMYPELDVKHITINILQSILKGDNVSMSLDLSQKTLMDNIDRKQPFLLVLDDAWDADCVKWDELLTPLKAFGKDSWVIVTTREKTVANTVSRMCGLTPIHLDILNEDGMWTIFEMHAFRGKNANDYPHLERIGRGIVKRLNGLPLAAQTIGSILNGSTDQRMWEKLLESELLREGRNMNDILMLSYYSLPGHLKQCFSYLSLFPKDFHYIIPDPHVRPKYPYYPTTNVDGNYFGSVIDVNQQWMAHNFCQKEKETKIDDIFNYGFGQFLNRSLLMHVDDDIIVIHDLIHDLAENIAEECYRESSDANMKLTNKVRHVSFFQEKSNSATLSKLEEHKRLRTLLFRLVNKMIDQCLLDNWFKSLTYLRVLYLHNNHITSLPNSIGNLKLLGYLHLDLPNLNEIPESTYHLYNLETLKVHRCNGITALPKYVTKLVNLKILSVDIEIGGIGALTNLQKLSLFRVRNEEGYKVSELKNLNRISGTLAICDLQNIQDKKGAQEAQLHQKHELQDVKFIMSLIASRPEQKDLDVLEGLCPSNNLKNLYISGYRGSCLPNWMINQYLSSLETIELSSCSNLKAFQSIATLQKLVITYCPELSGIPFWPRTLRHLELCNVKVTEIPATSLETVKLKGCKGLMNFQPPTTLHELTIQGCPQLSGNLFVHSNLRHIDLKLIGVTSIRLAETEAHCGLRNQELSLLPSTSASQSVSPSTSCLPFLKTLKIISCFKLDDCLRTLLQKSPSSLQYLKIDGYDHPLGDLSYFTTMRELELVDCKEKIIIDPTTLSSLKKLHISICPRASITSTPIEPYCRTTEQGPFSSFPRLEEVNIKGLNAKLIRNLLPGVKRSPLMELTISDWDESICLNDILESHILKLDTLENLSVSGCKMEQLMGLFRVVAKNPLKRLTISDCYDLIRFDGELESHFLQLTTLESLVIEKCHKLVSLPADLRGFKALRFLSIFDCPEILPITNDKLPNSLINIDTVRCPKWPCTTLEESEQGEE